MVYQALKPLHHNIMDSELLEKIYEVIIDYKSQQQEEGEDVTDLECLLDEINGYL